MRYVFIFILIFSFEASYAQLDDSNTVTEETYFGNDEPTTTFSNPEQLPATSSYKSEPIVGKKFDRGKWKQITGTTNYDQGRSKRGKRSGSNDERSGNGRAGEGSGSPGDYRQGDDPQGDRRHAPQDERYDDDDSYDDQDQSQSSSDLEISAPWGGEGLKIVFYALIIIIIGIILFFVLKNISLKRTPKPAAAASDEASHIEDITSLDVETPLERAQRSGNYKLAVRLYFLGLLKKLNETELIIWKKDKTNRDYLSELYAKARYYDEVRKLTLAYEQVWYGDHAIPAELFHELKNEFLAVDQQLNATYSREKN